MYEDCNEVLLPLLRRRKRFQDISESLFVCTFYNFTKTWCYFPLPSNRHLPLVAGTALDDVPLPQFLPSLIHLSSKKTSPVALQALPKHRWVREG